MTIEIETMLAAGAAVVTTCMAGYEWVKARISAKELQTLVNSARDATSQASDGGSSITDSEALSMIGETIKALSTID